VTEQNKQIQNKKLPLARNEDVEFSQEAADEDDLEVQHRAQLADQRNKDV
jgi:hypothetical protein